MYFPNYIGFLKKYLINLFTSARAFPTLLKRHVYIASCQTFPLKTHSTSLVERLEFFALKCLNR